MVPGRRYGIRLRMNDTAHRFAAGNRIRLALSTAYWPVLWPAPEAACLTIAAENSRLVLPLRPPLPADPGLREFAPAEGASPGPSRQISPPARTREMIDDAATGERMLTVANDDGEIVFERIGLAVGAWNRERYRIAPDDPLSAAAEFDWTQTLRRENWSIRTEIRARFTADTDAFHHRLRLDAFEGDTRLFGRDWALRIPRDNV